MNEQLDNVLTLDDLTRYLKIPKSSLYKMAREGKLPGQKIGRHWRFHRTSVDNWLMQKDGNDEQ